MVVLTTVASTNPQTQTDPYRLVLYNDAGTHFLLRSDRSGNVLPGVEVPQFTRQVEQINSRLWDLWGFSTIVLWTEPVNSEQDSCFAVMEVCKCDRQLPLDLSWFPIQDAASHLNDLEADFVIASHAKAMELPARPDPAPFSRLGWIYSVERWIEGIVGPTGIKLERFSQLSGSENTSLVTFETTKLPLWLKAVGPADPQEFVNTQILSRLFPEYLPPILNFDPSRNAWLMESGGDTLRHREDVATWRVVAQRLAALQIESVSRTAGLLGGGCRDLRFSILSNLVSPFFALVTDLMTQQTKTSPAPLTSQELVELAASLQHALDELSATGIPDALGHSDFNPGNILISGERCVFIDWSAAYVGNPLLTLEYLLAHRRKTGPAPVGEEDELRATYAHAWETQISPENLDRALQLARLVAVYASAIASNSWRDPERLARPDVRGYLRSLARIMKREADSLSRGLLA